MAWAITALVQAVMCGFVFTGVPGAILAFMGKSEWDQGRVDSAMGKLRTARILTIIGWVVIGVGILGYVLLMVFSIAFGAASSTM